MTRRLFAPLAVLLSCATACEPGLDSDVEDSLDDREGYTVRSGVSQASYPELEVPVPVSASSEDIQFKLGANKFRVPRESLGFYVSKNGDQVDFTTIQTYVPVLLQRDSLPTRGDVVLIAIQVRKDTPAEVLTGCNQRVQANTPMNQEEAKTWFDCVFGLEKFRRTVDPDLGLLRLTYDGRKTGIYYRRLDDYRRPKDGWIPTVTCSGTGFSKGWPCISHGWLPPNIEVSYQFYEKRLRDWPDIDAAVFNLIETYRIESLSDAGY